MAEAPAYPALTGAAALRLQRLPAPVAPRAPQTPRDAAALLRTIAQFRFAAEGVISDLGRLKKEARALAEPLGLAGLGIVTMRGEAGLAGEMVRPLAAAVAGARQAVTTLDAALAGARGPGMLGAAAARLRDEFLLLHRVMGGGLVTALDLVHARLDDLSYAADWFAGIAEHTVATVMDEARAGLSRLYVTLMNFAALVARYAPPGDNPLGDLAVNILGNLMGVLAVRMPLVGIPGAIVLGRLSSELEKIEQAQAEKAAGQRAAVTLMAARVLSISAEELKSARRSGLASQAELNRQLGIYQARAADERKQIVQQDEDPYGLPVWGPRMVPTDETLLILETLEWGRQAAAAWVGLIEAQQQALENAASFSAVAGERGSSAGPRPPRQPAHAGPVVHAADPLRERVREARALAANYADAAARGELGTPAAGATFARMADLHARTLRDLAAAGLDPGVERQLRSIRSVLERAAPVLSPANQRVDETAAAGPEPAVAGLAAAETAAEAAGGGTGGVALGKLSPLEEAAFYVAGLLDSAGRMAKDHFGGMVATFSPLGMVSNLLEGAFQGLAPLVQAFQEPLRIVGAALGESLRPALQILFPLFQAVAVIATYIGQLLFTVAGGVARIFGWVIHTIGSILDRVPFLGDFGLKSLGRGISDMGRGFGESAAQLGEARERIRNLRFGETEKSLEEMNAELGRVPAGFKVALAARQAAVAPPAGPAGAAPAYAAAPPPVDNRLRVDGDIVVRAGERTAREIWLEIREEMRRRAVRQSGAAAGHAQAA